MRGERKPARAVTMTGVESNAPAAPTTVAVDLTRLREELDQINQELLALIEKRGRVVNQVMRIKHEFALPVHDPAREQRMMRALLKLSSNVFPRAALERVFSTIFEVSRALGRNSPSR
jgi:3-deoxy-7-phosphoheptulonate synthase/chorismate mutase